MPRELQCRVGTSLEIALSKLCGKDDIITPITPSDERTRQQLGFKVAQYYSNPKWYIYLNGAKISYFQTKGEFFNHIPAIAVRSMVPSKIWNDYLIVSMVRSPYDAMISRYFWKGAERTGLSIEKFVEKIRICWKRTQLLLISPMSRWWNSI